MSLLVAQFFGMDAGIVIGGGLLLLLVLAVLIMAKLMIVGNPSEMLIVSGRRNKDGQGYRVLIGGRTLVIPILEKVSRLSLRNMQVLLEVKAQAGGGTMVPVLVNGVANVKVSSDPTERGNAIERFLDQPAGELQTVARETLEGGLRAVIGKMTPEEIVEDRDKFVATVMQEVIDDFRKLGLLIDSVNIQNVHDDEQYLESIARKANADVRAAARKAEAQWASEAMIKEAEAEAAARRGKAEREAEAKAAEATSHQRAEEARLGSEEAIADADNKLRIRKAELEAQARETEAQTHQRAEQARLLSEKAIAESDNDLRVRKAELAKLAAIKEAEEQEAAATAEEARLNATIVANANAQRDIAKAKAEGDAAVLLEDGKARAGSLKAEGEARAEAVARIGQSIEKHPEALKVMLVEMMPAIVEQLAASVNNVQLGDVTVIDGGDGKAIAGAAMGRAKTLVESLATIESILGIDLREFTRNVAGNMTGHDGAGPRSRPDDATGKSR